jgi:hypothetical protein
MNNGLFVDFVNPQMLQCIICKYEQTINDIVAQRSIMHKGLIKYNKVDGINPMSIYVQIAHMKLFAMRKQHFSVVVEPTTIHAQ